MPMKLLSYSEALPRLTLQPEKVLAYQDDFVPDQGWRAIWQVWDGMAPAFLYGHSFLLIKPETLARRLTQTAIDFVVDRGLVPTATATVPIPRSVAHDLWRFQWNAATTDRVELTNLVNAQSESILILLRDIAPGTVPTAIKLWTMKGSAHMHRRTREHLRTALGMHNRMLGFVHTPDEPADLVRDLSILLEPRALTQLLRTSLVAMSSRETLHATACRNAALDFQTRCAPHAVHPSEVIERRASGTQLPIAPQVLSALMKREHMRLSTILDAFGNSAPDWDALTLAAELIEHDKPDISARLDARAVGEMYERWSESSISVQVGTGCSPYA
jgi:hypothetical protein